METSITFSSPEALNTYIQDLLDKGAADERKSKYQLIDEMQDYIIKGIDILIEKKSNDTKMQLKRARKIVYDLADISQMGADTLKEYFDTLDSM